MKVLLTGFAQDVDFENPADIKNYLVFRIENSKEPLKLPVAKETITALMEAVYVDPKQTAEPSTANAYTPDADMEDEDRKDADEFGGDYSEQPEQEAYAEEREEVEEEPEEEQQEESEAPESEDDVPSV